MGKVYDLMDRELRIRGVAEGIRTPRPAAGHQSPLRNASGPVRGSVQLVLPGMALRATPRRTLFVWWRIFATTKAHVVRPFGQLGWTQKTILSAIGTRTTILSQVAFQLPKLNLMGRMWPMGGAPSV
jgi:hypothetical protein